MFQKITLSILLCFFLGGIVWAGEKNWTQQSSLGSKKWSSITMSRDGTKVALADQSPGYIYTSNDSGLTWTEQIWSGKKNWQSVISSGDGVRLAAADQNGFIYTSTDSGVTWTEKTGSGQRNWRAIVMSDDGKKLAAAAIDGYIYTSNDSGTTWTEQKSSGQRNWRWIASSDDGSKLVAVVQNGYIYTSTNSGAAWTEQKTTGARGWYGVASSADGTKLAAVEYGGNIFVSVNSGAAWSAKATRLNWVGIASSADGTKLTAIADTELVYVSSNSGGSWTGLQLSMARKWRSIVSSDDGTKFIGTVYDGPVYILMPPFIANISSDKPNDTYRPGDTIDIDVTFSEPVTSSGNVTVTLETGATDRTCTFTVVNTTTGTCNYAVQKGDVTNDLTVLSVSGTIKDVGDSPMTNFVPVKNLAENKAIKIDNAPAAVVTPVTPPKPTTPTTTPPKPTPEPEPEIDYDEPLPSAPEEYNYGEPFYNPETGETYFPEEEIASEEIPVLESAPEPVANVDIPVSYRDIDFTSFQGTGEFSPRQEVISIAVRINRINLTSNYICKNIYSDTTGYGVSPWTCQFAERSQAAGLISGSRSTFRPLDSVTRAEAYAILLKSACIVPNVTPDNWQIGVIETAMEYGLTVRDIESFAPNRAIQASEVYTIASRVKSLLEAHPEMCGD